MATQVLPGIFYSPKAHFEHIKDACPYAEVISLVNIEPPQDAAFKHHYFPAADFNDLQKLSAKAFKILQSASKDYPILVHCELGKVRCRTLIAMFLLTRMLADDVFKLIELPRMECSLLQRHADAS